MDKFWSRLISPLGPDNTRQDQAKDPAKRLHRFEKEYANLLGAWRKSSDLSKDLDAAENLEIRLQELTNILSDESRRPLPHPCIQFASLRQIYVPVGKIATTSRNEWIIKEAVLFFATLIESEEEAFVENTTFSASLTHLLSRITGSNTVRLGLDTESRVVELIFNITTKIKLKPEILPAWFKTQSDHPNPRRQSISNNQRGRLAGRAQRADFPLFYIMTDYIHHEGKIGDFARTGLLYVVEAASSSVVLEQWIVESDLSTLMATGLGALYSQLSRKLVIDHPPHDLPPILAFSDYEHPISNDEILSSCAPEFQSHLETFLSHLLFWQDVLNHCKSMEVKSTLLEHFHVIFLQQLLYPSLLESSDIDGGSSVAVLTYLRRILESLDHPDMINLILHYLLALPDHQPPAGDTERSSVSDARKRKSLDLATMMASKTDSAVTPLLFNLVDLLLACLRSRNQQTIHVTLHLVSAILKRHHRYAVMTLLKTAVLPTKEVQRTVGAHEQEIEYLMGLAESIGGQDNFDEAYECVLEDTMTRLESHPCSLKLVAPNVGKSYNKHAAITDSLPGAPREVQEHTVRPDDPLLNALLDLLETFFVNGVETNLYVTESIMDMGICGYMSVEGWLARSPNSYKYDEDEAESDEAKQGEPAAEEGKEKENEEEEEEEEDSPAARQREKEKALKECRRRPKWDQSSLPRLLDLLKKLCDQVASYKETIPRFEELLQQRREAFQMADMIVSNSLPIREKSPVRHRTPEPDYSEMSRATSPQRLGGFEGFAQRLLSEFGTPSRGSTPRGMHDQSRGSGSGTPSHNIQDYGMISPRAIPIPPPHEFPFGYGDPQKGHISRSYSPVRIGDEIGKSLGDIANQVAHFAAVDQTILARKVGLPEEKVSPIPVRLGKPTAEEFPEAGGEDGERQDDDDYDEDDSALSDGDKTEGETASTQHTTAEDDANTVSVSHILTNVIVYQSFLMELASLVQVRAGLFDEVRFV